ncbi:DUF4834 domain-containing protein [Mucilaginibacter hurinus]|uniref:DUF4834 domain-containing protein n=1 Tax=Mucilaginibacter hurinus TaxID=2201324 RepID=A0A367GMB9_9SPHI|nr:DUF4834 domain-containing protein [Mucilaginibacter hurinus]RCH54614.1 DUF4834 domain-containing protein [Mucilaginibacter hurinus]
MALLKFLFIAIAILYIIRMLARLLLPVLFQNMVKKAQQQQNAGYQQAKRSEGSIRVDYAPKTKPQVPDTEGDFVEYEEIKEK